MDYIPLYSVPSELSSVFPCKVSHVLFGRHRELVQKQPTVDEGSSSVSLCVRRTLASLIKRGETVCVCVSESWSEDVCQIFSMRCERAECCCCSPFWFPPEMFPAFLLSAEEQRSNENHLVMNGSSRRTSEWLTHRQWPRAKKKKKINFN